MLVRRIAESAVVEEALTNCFQGRGGIVAVRGPVGSGKTDLLRAAAAATTEPGARFEGVDALQADRQAPLSAFNRLLSSARLTADQALLATRLLDDVLLGVAVHQDESIAERAISPLLHRLTSILLEIAHEAPLVLSIDDAHLLDQTSMLALLHLARRIRTEPVLVLLTECSSVQRTHSKLWAELLSQPHCRFLRLNLLSNNDVAEMLVDAPELAGLCTAAVCHELSGGNPRLLNALFDDYRLDRVPGKVAAAATSYGQSVVTSMLRGDAVMMPMARALAVLGCSATPAQLAEMLDTDVASMTWAMEAAAEAGLLNGGLFTHECARQAVFELTSPQERMELHRRAATLLYQGGAPAGTVARHKIAAHFADAEWSVPVLREASEQALEEGDTCVALSCLQLAERGARKADRPEIRAAIVRAKWRVEPAAAERDVHELLNAERAGQLGGHDTMTLVRHLSWSGRPKEAAELLDRARASDTGRDADVAVSLDVAATCLAYAYPEHFDGPAAEGSVSSSPPIVTTMTGKLRQRAAGVRETVMREGFNRNSVEDAQVVLQQSRLDEAMYDHILASLDTLAQADCLDKAAYWCDALLAEAEQRNFPTWTAHLLAMRALISFRQGNLSDAERHGRTALGMISPRGFGVFIGLPLSVLMLVDSRSGQYEAAQNHLNVRVPDAMFQTPVGLHYLRARGRYYLARGYHRSAIEDFKACGELMVKWSLDLPGIVPWRTDLAEAYLSLGQPAQHLALDQLAKLGSYNRRTRGISLRVLAAATELRRRVPILREAVEMLQHSGDRLELCDALTDLSRAQYALGEYTKARLTIQRVQQLQIHRPVAAVKPHPAPVVAGPVAAPRQPSTFSDDPDVVKLSDAERRVALLAAQGQTNRQIASTLFITVSTVEQHLTRVYRKLEVKRRADLPYGLLGEAVAI